MKIKFLDGHEETFRTLAGANLRRANLKGKRLYKADIRGTILRFADLRGADLCKANMEGADLMCANLEDAELECANLKGACLEGASMVGANFQDAVLDDEQKAQVTTADDDGEKTQAKRMSEIAHHYDHAKEKHPVFADILTHKTHTSARYYKITRDEAHANGDCSPIQVLHAEYAEVLDAIDAKDKTQAVYECYDCIAVLLRLIDMIEETAEKEGWPEEARG